ncbi:hypothetical protein KGF54_003304 [Candida jiufengensis]|uniref:uncharacterized protein n=1 Tax=Candida jiufengensis TaxID=497108 RepID=UPI002224E93E|nr:uncharacterized protein KGF54_003304 [Candida jiufengensis]KAI5952437.1 hypothetical protein KGF54_003304 [Candida jiufengensis]
MTVNDISNNYIYNLDDDLLNSLKLLSFDLTTFENVEPTIKDTPNTSKSSKDIMIYYKSDLHRYNLKREQKNLPAINEEEFENLLETQSIESLSGSDYDTENESEDEINNTEQEQKVNTLIKNLEKAEINENESFKSHLNTKSPFVLFGSSMISDEKAIGIYKSIFNETYINNPLEYLKENQRTSNSKSAIFMIGGGHFAGAIISHEKNSNSGKSSKIDQVNVIESKTFHRYTTRRKQGGAQSASDNSRGKAISAGSSIRRYNEKALMEEVRELLSKWRDHLNECSTIYIRANGPTNKKVLIGYEGSPIKADDKRIQKIPFSTQRASLSEVKRSWVELSHFKLVDLPKVIPPSEKDKKPKESNVATETSDADKKINDKSNEIMPFFKKQKAPKFIKWVNDNKIDVNTFVINSEELLNNTPTFLHYASANGLSHMIQVLLINLKASPLVENYAGRYPAELGNQTSKRAFQIARHKLGDDYCNWELAKVGVAKSKEEFDEEDKKAEEIASLEKKKLLESQAESKNPIEKHRSINLNQNSSGLNDDQRARIMREQRARAAEARLGKK